MDDPELLLPVNGLDLTDLLFYLTIEIVAALEPDKAKADEKLEDVAGHLLTFAGKLPEGRLALLIGQVANNLIETEAGAGDHL